jgi:hypothetical protein
MWRGSAVENGYVTYLRTHDLEQAYDAAMRSYNLNVEENSAQGKLADEQAELIIPMISQCLLWTPPSYLNAHQIPIEHWFDGVPVPVIGFVDFAFENLDVDLKTTKACPSTPKAPDVRQVSLYRAARKRPGGILYVTSKRYAYYEVTDEMRDAALEEVADTARKITKLLTIFDNPQDILAALPIDYDDYRAPRRPGARTAADVPLFEAVTLQDN